VKDATEKLEAYDYAWVLSQTDSFFWSFCDDYLELVKSRRYGDFTPEGAASANSAMLVALSTMLRLFAPYLPFVTEEVWSWWHEGSVHRAAWPTPAEVVAEIGGADAEADPVFLATKDALRAVRRVKALHKRGIKTPATAVLEKARFAKMQPAMRDFQAAAHIRSVSFGDVQELELTFLDETPT